jgi:hypothetical protein
VTRDEDERRAKNFGQTRDEDEDEEKNWEGRRTRKRDEIKNLLGRGTRKRDEQNVKCTTLIGITLFCKCFFVKSKPIIRKVGFSVTKRYNPFLTVAIRHAKVFSSRNKMWKPGNSSKIICWHSIFVSLLVFGAFIAASSCQVKALFMISCMFPQSYPLFVLEMKIGSND